MIAVVVQRALAAVAAMLLAVIPAEAQVFQQGTVVPQHYMMWGASNVAQDAGGSAPLPQGLQPTEAGIVAAPNASSPFFPATATGHGPNGENQCLYDSPLGIGGHYLCFSPNLGSNTGAISFGSIGGGATGSFEIIVNGTKVPFPGPGTGTVVGPGSSTVGDLACWNNTLGTLLSDCAIASSNVLTQSAAAALYAPLISPALTGTPTAPTPTLSDNSTKIATTAFVKGQGYLTSTSLPGVAPQGRLTLTTHTPVQSSTISSTNVIFYDAYVGNTVPVFNGTVDVLLNIPGNELQLILSNLEEASGSVFDVFGINSSGSLVLCTATNGGGASGLGWSGDTGGSNTARGTGYSQLDNTTRSYLTNANTITNCFNATSSLGPVAAHQGTYLGTYFTVLAGQTGFSLGGGALGGVAGNQYIWNNYNRVVGVFITVDNGAAYTYTSNVTREARASTGNQVNFVTGLAEDGISASTSSQPNLVGALGATAVASPALDSTAALSTAVYKLNNPGTTGFTAAGGVTLPVVPKLGLHFISRNEASDNTNANGFNSLSSEFLGVTLKY